MKFSIKNFFRKCHQICSFLRIWSRLLKKSLMGNFFFYAVLLIGIHFHLLNMIMLMNCFGGMSDRLKALIKPKFQLGPLPETLAIANP